MHYIVRIFDEHLALCVCAPLCFSDVFIQVSIFKNMQVELEDYSRPSQPNENLFENA